MTNKTYYFDMDGVLANFHKEPYRYANAINKDWIANLDPFMDNVNLVRELLIAGVEVYILSKAASESAKLGKLEWLAKFIPEMPVENVIVIVGNGKKTDFIRTETGVLVDDDIKNTRPWMKAGYEAITLEYRGQTVVLN